MSWRIETILPSLRTYLEARGLESARLEAELLLAHVLGCSRTQLYIHPEQPLSEDERERLRHLTKRRATGEPMAYLLGEREFYGHRLHVTPDVLIPRPETEHLVEVALRWVAQLGIEAPRIADIGCGSGAIAVALAMALPQAQLVASDLSDRALAIARHNVARFELTERVTLVAADLFGAQKASQQAALDGPFDIIVSNPPYVRQAAGPTLARDVRDFEPHLALFGGDDGLSVIRRLLEQAPRRLRSTGLLALEMGYDQAREVGALLGDSWPQKAAVRDLAGHWRVACAWRNANFDPHRAASADAETMETSWPEAGAEMAQSDAVSEQESKLPEFNLDEAARTVRGHQVHHQAPAALRP